MASTSTRQIAMQPWATNLPIIPRVLALPQEGDTYPSGRAISQSSYGDGTGSYADTWIAIYDVAALEEMVLSRVGSAISDFRGLFVFNPATAMVGVTPTGGRPRNPEGGVRGYTVTIGTATLKNGGSTITTQSVYENRQPVLDGNTLVECRKLPTYTAGTSGAYASGVYLNGTTAGPLGTTFAAGAVYATRWIGGNITIGCRSNAGTSMDVYVLPINPALISDDVSGAVLVGTVADGADLDIFAADLALAGIVQWNQFWVLGISTGPADPASFLAYSYQVAGDVPPLYDAPGYEVNGLYMIKGGYLP